MKYKCPAHRILVKIKSFDEQFKVSEDLKRLGFKIAHESGQEDFVRSGTDQGTVVQIGPLAWKVASWGYGTADWQPWCEVGDEIIFAKYAGKMIIDPDDGTVYMAINDEDVILIVEKE